MKYLYNLNIFLSENSTSFYLLGAFITDGCIDGPHKVKIVSKDFEWLSDMRNLICTDLPIANDRGTHVLKIYNTTIVNWLRKFGCVPNKSLTVKFPSIPPKYLPDFFRGCMDGDGSVGSYILKKHNNKFTSCYLLSASKDFIDTASLTLHSIGIEHYFYKDKIRETNIKGKKFMKKNPTYRIFFTNAKCEKFLKWIYYDGFPISLKRKYRIAQTIIKESLQTP